MSRKEQIIEAASSLIAKVGRANVSTASIAQQAGVSEGLIFKHFKNKDGLMSKLQDEMKAYIQAFCNESEKMEAAPSIQHIMEWPFNFSDADKKNWSLILFSLHDHSFSYNELFTSMHTMLSTKLKALNVQDNDIEAELIISYVVGFATTLLRNSATDAGKLLTVLQKRYAA